MRLGILNLRPNHYVSCRFRSSKLLVVCAQPCPARTRLPVLCAPSHHAVRRAIRQLIPGATRGRPLHRLSQLPRGTRSGSEHLLALHRPDARPRTRHYARRNTAELVRLRDAGLHPRLQGLSGKEVGSPPCRIHASDVVRGSQAVALPGKSPAVVAPPLAKVRAPPCGARCRTAGGGRGTSRKDCRRGEQTGGGAMTSPDPPELGQVVSCQGRHLTLAAAAAVSLLRRSGSKPFRHVPIPCGTGRHRAAVRSGHSAWCG